MITPKFYVTLCARTESATKAIPWLYNAYFESLLTAEKYRDSLLPLVARINSAPQNQNRIPIMDGERIMVITATPAPNVNYVENGGEFWAKRDFGLKVNKPKRRSEKSLKSPKRRTNKTPEYVQLYHGGLVKRSTYNWLKRKDEDTGRFILTVLGFMLLLELLSRCS